MLKIGLISIAVAAWLIGHGDRTSAQILPDDTLGNESSVVTPRVRVRGQVADRINGGAVRGNNLFHSFRVFNVNERQRVYFSNPDGVENIFSRITEAPSVIQGTLGVEGNANLFLLNPNGVIFGANAQLDLGGSFTVSTSDRLLFTQNREFSTTSSQVPPLLSILVPIGLQRQVKPQGDITNDGVLAVSPRQTVTLFGNTITQTGTLITSGGEAQIIAGNDIVLDGSTTLISTTGGSVLLDATGDVILRNRAAINTSPLRSAEGNTGRILVQAGGDVRLISGAALLSTVSEGAAGNAGRITVRAGENISVRDRSIMDNTTRGDGNGARIDLRGQSIFITDNARILASTSSSGIGGSIQLRALDAIVVNNSILTTGPSQFSTGTGGSLVIRTGTLTAREGSILSTGTDSSGQAGNFNIFTNRLIVENAILSTQTLSNGNAGNLNIRATEAVDVNTLGSIDTNVREGASGRGGNLTVRTRELEVQEGGQIASGTFGQGEAGDLIVIAANTIHLRGSSANGVPSGLFTASQRRNNAGLAGNIQLTTGDLILEDRAVISSESLQSAGGEIEVEASTVRLSGDSRITARVASGSGRAGDITMNTSDRLQLTNSNITTSANNSGGNINLTNGNIRLQGDSDIRTNSGINGGNITVNAETLVALDDSDIIAAAKQQGGDINFVDTVAFFDGYNPKASNADPDTLENNAASDINASGNDPGDIDVGDTSFIQNSLTDLPDNSLNPDRILTSICLNRTTQDGRFTITGTDGLPQRPGNASQSSYPTGAIQPIPAAQTNPERPWQMGDAIVEPQDVHRLPNGRLALGQDCGAS